MDESNIGKIDVVIDGVTRKSLLSDDYAHTVTDRFGELGKELENLQNEVNNTLNKAKQVAEELNTQLRKDIDSTIDSLFVQINGCFSAVNRDLININSFINCAPSIFQISKRTEYIDIHYLYKDYLDINKIEKGDWIDLYAADDVIIPINQFRVIPLGISMRLPEMYEAYILPRSSMFKNWGIIMPNSQAVIDNSYNGTNDEWKLCAYCLQPKAEGIYTDESDSKPFRYLAGKKWGNWVLKHFCRRKYEAHRYTLVRKGDRICQFRIQEHMPHVYFDIKDKLNDEDRGGLGSTGTR